MPITILHLNHPQIIDHPINLIIVIITIVVTINLNFSFSYYLVWHIFQPKPF